MSDTEKIQKMNKELKIYINESSFISNKCRNQLLKLFEEEFRIDLDIGNYQNVDLSIQDDFRILYRDDLYESRDKIIDMEDLEKRYQQFQEKADKLIKRKDIDFSGRRNFNNFTNLIVVICLILFAIAVVIFGIHAFLIGDYFDCLWFVCFVVPWLFPKLKNSLHDRFIQAKQYLKSLFKKIK